MLVSSNSVNRAVSNHKPKALANDPLAVWPAVTCRSC